MKSKSRFSLVLPSTKAFYKEGRNKKGYHFLDFLHGYIYGRWPYFYIGMGIGTHPLRRWLKPLINILGPLLLFRNPNNGSEIPSEQKLFADTYHGKVVPLEAARQLVSVKEDVHLPDLEQIIPYNKAREILLRNPDHIVALDCPCRVAQANPCLPLDVCLIIGEPFAAFVHDHHPKRSRWISRTEALDILQAEDERGHVHHAFFKDAMLGRFYAICNCCSCCCGAMHAHQTGTPMLASSGYIAQVDPNLCIACGECAYFCQFSALSLTGDIIDIDGEQCMGCGICISKCASGALALHQDPAKGVPFMIQELIQAN